MTGARTASDRLISSIHRSILGALLAIVAMIGIASAYQGVLIGSIPIVLIGAIIGTAAIAWIGSLFVEGLRESEYGN